MNSLGNDFVIVDERFLTYPDKNIKAMSNRRFGIGCDQFLILRTSSTATVKVLVYNRDGSEAKMCGNGCRAVAWLLFNELNASEVSIELGENRVLARIAESQGEKVIPRGEQLITVCLPKPCLDENLSHSVSSLITGESIENLFAINLGNKHLVFFIKNIKDAAIVVQIALQMAKSVGIERINMNFAQSMDFGVLKLKTWEAGCGFTKSCGSGAAATAAAARLIGHPNICLIKASGGDTITEWKDGVVSISATSNYVFKGDYSPLN